MYTSHVHNRIYTRHVCIHTYTSNIYTQSIYLHTFKFREKIIFFQVSRSYPSSLWLNSPQSLTHSSQLSPSAHSPHSSAHSSQLLLQPVLCVCVCVCVCVRVGGLSYNIYMYFFHVYHSQIVSETFIIQHINVFFFM